MGNQTLELLYTWSVWDWTKSFRDCVFSACLAQIGGHQTMTMSRNSAECKQSQFHLEARMTANVWQLQALRRQDKLTKSWHKLQTGLAPAIRTVERLVDRSPAPPVLAVGWVPSIAVVRIHRAWNREKWRCRWTRMPSARGILALKRHESNTESHGPSRKQQDQHF